MLEDDALDMPVDVRALRKSRGMTQATLADLMGVKQQTVSKWEKGDPISRSNATLLCHALGIVGQEAVRIVDRLAPRPEIVARPDTVTIGVSVPVATGVTVDEADELRQELNELRAALAELAAEVHRTRAE